MTDLSTREPVSAYIQYLPAIFRELDARGDHFIGRFLLAFEQVLRNPAAPGDTSPIAPEGLEQLLDHIHDLFDPTRTRSEFLDWLAGWVALTLRADWTDTERRRFISRIVSLYRLRGTRAGMIAMLNAYTNAPCEVYDTFDGFPHYFQVELALSGFEHTAEQQGSGERMADVIRRQQKIARAIIEQEKPAHTFYNLRFTGIPTIQVGVRSRSTVGVNTWIGAISEQPKET
jgi:phage tail-like protein